MSQRKQASVVEQSWRNALRLSALRLLPSPASGRGFRGSALGTLLHRQNGGSEVESCLLWLHPHPALSRQRERVQRIGSWHPTLLAERRR